MPSAASTICFQVIERFVLFDLGDHQGRRTMEIQEPLQLEHFLRRANEAEAHEVDAVLGGPDGVLFVVVAHRGQADLHARQIDSLPTANQSGLHAAAFCAVASLSFDQHAHRAVGQHHAVADLQLVDQRRRSSVNRRGSLDSSSRMKRNSSSSSQSIGTAGNFAEANLGAGQIDEHGDGMLDFRAQLADAMQHFFMLGNLAVRHVQSKNIDSGVDQCRQLRLLATGGADRGDDLRVGAQTGKSNVHSASRLEYGTRTMHGGEFRYLTELPHDEYTLSNDGSFVRALLMLGTRREKRAPYFHYNSLACLTLKIHHRRKVLGSVGRGLPRSL